jgi:hypothetical protein
MLEGGESEEETLTGSVLRMQKPEQARGWCGARVRCWILSPASVCTSADSARMESDLVKPAAPSQLAIDPITRLGMPSICGQMLTSLQPSSTGSHETVCLLKTSRPGASCPFPANMPSLHMFRNGMHDQSRSQQDFRME